MIFQHLALVLQLAPLEHHLVLELLTRYLFQGVVQEL